MTTTSGPQRPMRADARRNYERLLDAARAAFTEHGTDAPLDDIAKRAGVGSGTLYRHFPTRLDLIEAIFADGLGALIDRAAELTDEPDAGKALVTWLRAVVTHATAYQGLAGSLMTALHEGNSALAGNCHKMIYDAGGRLLERAQATGKIRADVELGDILKLANGIALASEQDTADPDLPDRLLAMMLEGLRTP
jgi:AcrR family transcriptional regulator